MNCNMIDSWDHIANQKRVPPIFSFANTAADIDDSSQPTPHMTVHTSEFFDHLLNTADDATVSIAERGVEEFIKEPAPPAAVEVEAPPVETPVVEPAPPAAVEVEAPPVETPVVEPAPPAAVEVEAPTVETPVVEPAPPAAVETKKVTSPIKGLVYAYRPSKSPLHSTTTYDVIVSPFSHRICKWESVLKFLSTDVDLTCYSHVWFPDMTDDVTDENTAALFDAIAQSPSKVTVAQPSVLACDKNGYTHTELMQQPIQNGTAVRSSALVEHKYPCFSADFVSSVLRKFLQENAKHIKSGWGLDLWWSSHPNVRDAIYVVDSIAMQDTYNPSIARTIGRKELQFFKRTYGV